MCINYLANKINKLSSLMNEGLRFNSKSCVATLIIFETKIVHQNHFNQELDRF